MQSHMYWSFSISGHE